jgi:hypothetical protein
MTWLADVYRVRFRFSRFILKISSVGHSSSPVTVDNRRTVECASTRSFNANSDSTIRGVHHVSKIDDRPIAQVERPAPGMVKVRDQNHNY